MLLTKQPAHHGHKSFHDCPPPTPPPTSAFSPAVKETDKALPRLPPSTSSSSSSFPIVIATDKALPPLPPPTSGFAPVVKGSGKALPPLPPATSSSTPPRISTPPHGLLPPAVAFPQPRQPRQTPPKFSLWPATNS
ncbi:hypothetical protein DL98DRAFT_304769 [Cadophora sp. DSE1049]|nr:hypothetical protein DL98DRAFT_304769 [Cadophora sp. DSE1049]